MLTEASCCGVTFLQVETDFFVKVDEVEQNVILDFVIFENNFSPFRCDLLFSVEP